MTDLFNDTTIAPETAAARLREGHGNWRDRAMLGLSLIVGFTGTAEDIRIRLIMKGLGKPHHHNAWGELIKEALRRDLIFPTGERRRMKTGKSHARETAVYRVRERA
jgi:hypothetical protein